MNKLMNNKEANKQIQLINSATMRTSPARAILRAPRGVPWTQPAQRLSKIHI